LKRKMEKCKSECSWQMFGTMLGEHDSDSSDPLVKMFTQSAYVSGVVSKSSSSDSSLVAFGDDGRK